VERFPFANLRATAILHGGFPLPEMMRNFLSEFRQISLEHCERSPLRPDAVERCDGSWYDGGIGNEFQTKSVSVPKKTGYGVNMQPPVAQVPSRIGGTQPPDAVCLQGDEQSMIGNGV
jgi:hypothetical protein